MRMKHMWRMALHAGALALVLLLGAACTTVGGPSETDGPAGSTDPTDPTGPTEPSTEAETDPPRVIDGSAVFGDGYNTHMTVGFDEQGRVLEATSAVKEDKEVGIFYWLWLGTPHFDDIYDVSKILASHGQDVVFNQDTPVSPKNQPHWWGEPALGYYNSADEWVIRKHMEMLTTAGVDFIAFDTTNTVTYDAAAIRVMRVIVELREDGWDAPQVVYYTHTAAIPTMTTIYENIYKKHPELEEAWYKVDGKPMIIGYENEADDIKATGEIYNGQPYRPGDLPQELKDFFYVRFSRWPGEEPHPNGLGYTEWDLPQKLNGDLITVSVATHPRPPFSYSITDPEFRHLNYGRGFDVATMTNKSEDIYKGTFFDYQWKTVFDNYDNTKYVFITGWNEWVAWKLQMEGYNGYILVDNVDTEFSRDIEPMAGGYEDAYYIQMMTYIRRFKYESLDGLVAKTLQKTIDITGASAQWEDVNAIYRRIGRDDGERKKYGASKTVDYACDPVENNIVEVRVTADAENIYMMIETTEPIQDMADGASNRMNIFIGCGRPEMGKGWEGYEFAINRERQGSTAAVEALNADYSGSKVGEAAFSVSGHVLQISIPRAVVGLADGGDFYFKVADGVNDPSEIMNYYSSGRSLPLGRLSYLYQIG